MPWSEALNEYDNQDDAGYTRRDVQGQQRFLDTEVDLHSDTRSVRSTEHLSTGQPSHAGLTGEEEEEEEDDDDGDAAEEEEQEEGRGDGYASSAASSLLGDTSLGARTGTGTGTGAPASSCADPPPHHAQGGKDAPSSTRGSSLSGTGAVVDLLPSGAQHALAPPASPREGAPKGGGDDGGGAALELFPSSADAWDLGPVGIRIADPVTTPTKSSGGNAAAPEGADSTRPVLSRVESLSSSFKDFDIEALGEDAELHTPSRRVSATTASASQQQQQDGLLLQPTGAGLASSSSSDPTGGAAAEVIDFHPLVLAPSPSNAHSGGAPSPSGAAPEGGAPPLLLQPSGSAGAATAAAAAAAPSEPPTAEIDLGPPPGLLGAQEPPEPDLTGLMTLTAAAQQQQQQQQIQGVGVPPRAPSSSGVAGADKPAAGGGASPEGAQAAGRGQGPARCGAGVGDVRRGCAPCRTCPDPAWPCRRRGGCRPAGGGGGGFGGGFSFPVATPPSEPQPDHRLFKSWPSVRSRCVRAAHVATSPEGRAARGCAGSERERQGRRCFGRTLGLRRARDAAWLRVYGCLRVWRAAAPQR